MYTYLPYNILAVGKKQLYFKLIVKSEHYLSRTEDNVKNKFLEVIDDKDISLLDKIDGYLIYDELGLNQLEYLNKFLAWEYVDEMNTSIFEKLAKQNIVLYQ